MASVLIVEDRVLHAQIIHLLLDSRHSVVDVVETVEEAIEAVRSYEPDVVLMDLNLTEGNGIEATEAIKSEAPWIPIIVSTAHVNDELRLRASKAGAVGYLTKPYGEEELTDAIESALGA